MKKILDNNSCDKPWVYILDHLLKSGTVEVRSGVSVIYIESGIVGYQLIACHLLGKQRITGQNIPLLKVLQEPFCVVLDGIGSSACIEYHVSSSLPLIKAVRFLVNRRVRLMSCFCSSGVNMDMAVSSDTVMCRTGFLA